APLLLEPNHALARSGLDRCRARSNCDGGRATAPHRRRTTCPPSPAERGPEQVVRTHPGSSSVQTEELAEPQAMVSSSSAIALRSCVHSLCSGLRDTPGRGQVQASRRWLLNDAKGGSREK